MEELDSQDLDLVVNESQDDVKFDSKEIELSYRIRNK